MTMTKLFVGNLSFEVTQDDLRAAFAVYGPVSSANVVMDRSNGGSRGFGCIEMPLQAHAMAAIQGLNGTDRKGRSINVSGDRPRRESGARAYAPCRGAVVTDG